MKMLLTMMSLLCLISCSGKGVAIINVKRGNVDTLQHEVLSNYMKINVGDSITHQPIVSQVYFNQVDSNYILLDNKSLFFFDLKSGNLIKSVNFGDEYGTLDNYSGFYFHNSDSIYLYNYGTGDLFLINGDAEKLNVFSIKMLAKQKDMMFDATPLNASPIFKVGDDFILSGWMMGHVKGIDKMAVSCALNTTSSELVPLVGYPDNYLSYGFGSVSFNFVFNTHSNNGDIVYSFPAEHDITILSADKKISKTYAGSRYVDQITSLTPKMMYNQQEELDYYLSEASYSNILYDQFSDVYYRFVEHPTIDNKDILNNYSKPFSIIVLNKNFEIIGETTLFDNHASFDRSNMHIVPEGILLRNASEKDESLINFSLIKINI